MPDKRDAILKHKEHLLSQCKDGLSDDDKRSLIRPFESDGMMEVLLQMSWKFLTTDAGVLFITSDSPVFFDEPTGLLRCQDFTFPVSREVALLGTRAAFSMSYETVTPHMLKWINRRTAAHAIRYVYAPVKKESIVRLASKTHEREQLI